MKNNTQYVSLVVSAALAGAAFFALSKTSFSAFFQSDLAVAATASVAIVGLAIRDYSRRTPSLAVRANIERPTLQLRDGTSVKTSAYGIKSTRSERLAA